MSTPALAAPDYAEGLGGLLGDLERVARPRERPPVDEWADRERVLSSESSAVRGSRYETAATAYIRPIYDAWLDPQCEIIALMAAVQVAKTEAAITCLGYTMDVDPGPSMMALPTEALGSAWSKDRLSPLLRDTPCLRGLVRDSRTADGQNSVLHKAYPGGTLTVTGANSASGLAARPIRYLWADEIDIWPAALQGGGGDPLQRALRRTTAFYNRKVMLTSSPEVSAASRIERWFLRGTRERWHVPCPGCGHVQNLVWSQVEWREGRPETAVYTCVECGAEWSDADRHAAVRRGVSVAEAPDAIHSRIRSFHVTGLLSPFVELGAMAEEYVAGKRQIDVHRVWTMQSLGEPWREREETVEAEDLYRRRREHYPERLPAEALVVTVGADVQKDRLEAEVVAHSAEGETWSLGYYVLSGRVDRFTPASPEDGATAWEQLDEVRALTFPHESGWDLPISGVCIDSGGLNTDEVYLYCDRHRHERVYPIKGRSERGAPLVIRSTKPTRRPVRLWHLNVDAGKDRVMARLGTEDPGPGYCHFPADYSRAYFEGLTAEQLVPRRRGRAVQMVWETKPGSPGNEPLDCRVYAYAALELLQPRWARLEARYAVSPEQAEARRQAEEERSRESPAQRRRGGAGRRGGNWVNSWRGGGRR